jgi:hypothetical protein
MSCKGIPFVLYNLILSFVNPCPLWKLTHPKLIRHVAIELKIVKLKHIILHPSSWSPYIQSLNEHAILLETRYQKKIKRRQRKRQHRH